MCMTKIKSCHMLSYFHQQKKGFVEAASKKFSEWEHKINKAKYGNQILLITLKTSSVGQNILMTLLIKLQEYSAKPFYGDLPMRRCHMSLDVWHVCRSCAPDDSLRRRKRRKTTGSKWGEHGECVIKVLHFESRSYEHGSKSSDMHWHAGDSTFHPCTSASEQVGFTEIGALKLLLRIRYWQFAFVEQIFGGTCQCCLKTQSRISWFLISVRKST